MYTLCAKTNIVMSPAILKDQRIWNRIISIQCTPSVEFTNQFFFQEKKLACFVSNGNICIQKYFRKYIKIWKNHHKKEQFCVLNFQFKEKLRKTCLVSSSSPKHSLPPPAAGWRTFRRRSCCPSPQLAEQRLHSENPDHRQSTLELDPEKMEGFCCI